MVRLDPTRVLQSALIAGTALFASPAAAQTFEFNGTRENNNPLLTPPGGRCVPSFFNTVTIAPGGTSSTGTSNLGPFTSTQSHCVSSAPPTPLSDGQFTYTFRAGDTITGTYSGAATNSATPGVFNATENLVITGGTGRFAGATGSITSNGQLRIGPGPSGIFSGTLAGSIAATQTSTGEFGTALGAPSAATGLFSTSVGAFSTATAERGVALGSFAESTGPGAIAIGDGSLATGLNAVAVGQATTAQGVASTAIGHNADATGLASFAGGVSAQATNVGATAVGRVANASAAQSTAIGAASSATFAGSTAIGLNAATTAANQVSLGGAGSSVRAGDIAASTAAQTGTVSVATVDGSGTLGANATIIPSIAALQASSGTQAGQIGTLQSGQAALQASVDDLFDLRRVDRRNAQQGIAAAVAMGQAAMPSEPGRTSYVLNGAAFRGEFAVGGSIMHRVDAGTPLAIGVGFSFAGNKNNAFRAGIAGEF